MPVVTNPLTGAQTWVPGDVAGKDSTEAIEALEKRVLAMETRLIDLETLTQSHSMPNEMDIDAMVDRMRDQLEPPQEEEI